MAALLRLTTGIVYVRSWSGTFEGATLAADTIKLDSTNEDVVLSRSAASELKIAGASEDITLNLATSNTAIIGSSTGVASLGLASFTDLYLSGSGATIRLLSDSGTLKFGGSEDTILTRDAANTLAQRNGTAAQQFNLYNTYTSSTNNEFLQLKWSGNQAQLATNVGGGGGSPRALVIGTVGASTLIFKTSDTNRWEIGASEGSLLTSTDNTYDIGASGATRPRNIYAGSSVYAGAASSVGWAGRSSFSSGADGTITAGNAAFDGFTRLNLGPAGAATTTSKLLKKVTAIADNTATTVFTVTIPNANHAASIKLRFLSSNGSTDAFESSRTAEGTVVIARISGAATAATAVAISDAAIATSGTNTHTLAYSVTAMTGDVSATQTFEIQVTIDDNGNVGGNQVVAIAEVLNAEATGVTIA